MLKKIKKSHNGYEYRFAMLKLYMIEKRFFNNSTDLIYIDKKLYCSSLKTLRFIPQIKIFFVFEIFIKKYLLKKIR